jgi:hypothetical protein
MDIFTIYYDPLDYPTMYAARRFDLDKPTLDFFVDRQYEAVRDWVFKKKAGDVPICLGRDPNDDPKILESWI